MMRHSEAVCLFTNYKKNHSLNFAFPQLTRQEQMPAHQNIPENPHHLLIMMMILISMLILILTKMPMESDTVILT